MNRSTNVAASTCKALYFNCNKPELKIAARNVGIQKQEMLFGLDHEWILSKQVIYSTGTRNLSIK